MNNTEITIDKLSEVAGGAPLNTHWVYTCMNEKQVKRIICVDWYPWIYRLKPLAFLPFVVGR